MATWAHQKEFNDFSKLLSAIEDGGIWIHRPLIIHERNTTGKKCPCGCDSMFAIAVETREYIDVLIDPGTGVRRVRQRAKDKAAWDELAAKARKITLPHRVSRKQLEALTCKAKVLAIFGGVRGGKTSFLADTILSNALLYGGEGSQIWWVAPTLDKTNIGLNKLTKGEVIGKGAVKRTVQPLIPPEIIRSVPSSPKSDKPYIELIDGTRIWLKYASRDGGNLKGEAPIFAGLDEGCEVDKRSNYGELNRRLMEGGGQLFISTTPVAGHFLKDEVYDRGVSLEQYKPGDLTAWTHITCFDNPWVSEENIQKEIDRCVDQQEVRREIYGEWVGSGPLLWRHFDPDEHIIPATVREPADLGLVDITEEVTRQFYGGRGKARHCGQDFNLYPMGLVELRFAYHPKDPQRKVIAMAVNEVVEKIGTIYEFCDILEKRGMRNDSVGIACDATGAQYNSYRLAHGIKDKNSTQAREMTRQGYRCRPCRTTGGKPSNPAVLDRQNVMHKLMNEFVSIGQGKTFPRFLASELCVKTIISLRVQEADDRGNPIKESGTETDRLSSPTDALGYGLWPVLSREYEGGSSVEIL
ncbi:MAG: hypothetical protein AAFP15_16010 [Bacteroidota bacterium]